MKMKSAFLLSLAFSWIVATPPARAQAVAGAPEYVDYQGTVFDGTDTNKPLGSSVSGSGITATYTAAPTNYTMHFKIYSAQTGGTLIWAEAQTVTVSLGQFSVRLGSGSAIAGILPEPPTAPAPLTGRAIASAFNLSKDRYLELTVVPTGSATGTPITPRLAFMSSPFSFVAERAKTADSINGGTFAGDVTATSTITGGTYKDGAFTNGTFTGNGAGLTNLDGAKLTSGTVSDARLSSNVALLDRPGQVFKDLAISNNGKLRLSNSGVTGDNGGIEGWMAESDTFRIHGAGSTNNGALYIDTFDDGNEPIIFRQNSGNTPNERMRIASNGKVGIWTYDPQVPLDVAGSTTQYIDGNTASTGTNPNAKGNPDFYGANGSGGLIPAAYVPISIQAENSIAGTSFIAKSDKRIKDVVGRSDSRSDLELIRRLQVTDYRMKDRLTCGSGIHKGLIAQEVETIMPEAVNRSTNFIPDVYAAAVKTTFNSSQKTLTVEMAKPHQLAVGDKVRVYADKETIVSEVLAVSAPTTFSVRASSSSERAFVYGRQVSDFMAVDYDRIFTAGISAIQELDKRVKILEATAKDTEVSSLSEENTALRERVAALEAKDKARDAKMASFEKRLESPDHSATRTVSLTKGPAAE
ncbi:MAG: hypothetical protein RLZZ522_1773 [Verrucomicrobiota bacterium]